MSMVPHVRDTVIIASNACNMTGRLGRRFRPAKNDKLHETLTNERFSFRLVEVISNIGQYADEVDEDLDVHRQ